MQTDLLFERFDDLLITSDDVAHLETAILQLAVRGKLVPQEPDDEPAAELLERIQAERERLIRERRIRKAKPLPPIETNETPYELPKSWIWTRLGELGETQTGTTPSKRKPEFFGSDYPFIKPADISKNSVNYDNEGLSQLGIESGRLIRAGSALMVCIGGSIGKVGYVERDCSCNQQINAITPYLGMDDRFFAYFMRSPYFQNQVLSRAPQTTLPILSKGKWIQIPFPLPPLVEQKRIVAQVDALLAQTHALAAQLEGADAALVPTAQAAFHSLLDAPDTATQRSARLRAAWQRIAEHLNTLTGDPRTIEALKQTILQLAVQGKLVPQDLDDEPASVLIERVKEEKAQLVQEKRIRKPKRLPNVLPGQALYQVPEAWKWCRLAEVSLDIHYGYTASADFSRKDYRLLRITDIQNNMVDWESVPGCEIDESKVPKYLLEDNDILIARTGGTVGKSYLVRDLAVKALFASYLIRVVPVRDVNPQYLKLFLESPLYWEQLIEQSKGTGQPNVNATSLSELALPLPPLAEQKRIVAKVEALLSLCDALSAQVVQAQEVRARLLQAVLNGGQAE